MSVTRYSPTIISYVSGLVECVVGQSVAPSVPACWGPSEKASFSNTVTHPRPGDTGGGYMIILVILSDSDCLLVKYDLKSKKVELS